MTAKQLNAREVIDKFYAYFEKKSNKIIFDQKISVVYDCSSYFCDADGHSPSRDYAHYAECLIFDSHNVIILGAIDNKNSFIKIFNDYGINKEKIIDRLKSHDVYHGNFCSDVIIEESEGLIFCPIMSSVLMARNWKNKTSSLPHLYGNELREPECEVIVERYYNSLVAKKEILNSFVKKKGENSEKYSANIAGFLASELENLLK